MKDVKNKKDQIINFLQFLYLPKGKAESYGRLFTFLEENYVRSINKHDAGTSRQRVLEIETSGNPPRESFQGWKVKYIDINHVGEMFAEVYIYTDEQGGTPKKIKIQNPKIAIIY